MTLGRSIRSPLLVLGFVCLLFLTLAALFLPYAGIQDDEAIFSNPIYQPPRPDLSIPVFGRQFPLMISDHIGALKTWIYSPIFAVLHPSEWSVRLPMALASALTIALFFLLTKRIAGSRTALFGAFLLATDPSFFLMDVFDWGPVALERLLLVTAALCVTRYRDHRRIRDLCFGGFALGLALWNRADFVWACAGIFVAAILVYARKLIKMPVLRVAPLALASFLMGFLPALIYNVKAPNETLRANAHLQFVNFPGKFHHVIATFDGSDLFSFLVYEDTMHDPKVPASSAGRFAASVHRIAGTHRHAGMFWALLVSIVAVPLWWPSKAARFALVYLAVTWTSMAVTFNAGAAGHHVAMLLPAPQFFVAITLGALPIRWLANAIVALLCLLNLLVLNQYLYQFERDGAAGNFTDALPRLSAALTETPGQTYYVTDWGMLNTLYLLHQGRIAARPLSELLLSDTLPPELERVLDRVLSDPAAVFVDHVPEHEVFRGVSERLITRAALRGKRLKIFQVIEDSNGRPVFQIGRLMSAS